MMFNLFEGKTADDIWRQTASAFAGNAMETESSRCGDMREILHAAISISDPRQRWMFSRRPALNPAFAIAEVIWILSGRQDSAFLNFFNSKLPQYAGTGDVYAGAYGYRLRHHFGMDQLRRAYNALKSNSDSRQVVLQVWSPETDLPLEMGKPASPDVPCNLLSMLKVRDGKLEWTQIIRSNDLFLGLPHNIVQFTSLQEIMAGWLGLEIGSYNQVSNSLHVYERDLQNVLTIEDSEQTENQDSLALSIETSEAVISLIAKQVDDIIKGITPCERIIDIADGEDVPESFRNLRCILCAEASRRLDDQSQAEKIMAMCSNPALDLLWQCWRERITGGLETGITPN